MLADRHSKRITKDVSKFGWLVYLRQPEKSDRRSLIKPQAQNFCGLIQTRNSLATSLKKLIARENLEVESAENDNVSWNPTLPPPLDRERVCSWCPYLFTCGLFRGEK